MEPVDKHDILSVLQLRLRPRYFQRFEVGHRHSGIIRAPSRSTVAYQNAHRDSNVLRDIFHALFRHFGQQAAWQRKGFRFKMPIKLLDSTLVSLTMSVYDWAHYTTKK